MATNAQQKGIAQEVGQRSEESSGRQASSSALSVLVRQAVSSCGARLNPLTRSSIPFSQLGSSHGSGSYAPPVVSIGARTNPADAHSKGAFELIIQSFFRIVEGLVYKRWELHSSELGWGPGSGAWFSKTNRGAACILARGAFHSGAGSLVMARLRVCSVGRCGVASCVVLCVLLSLLGAFSSAFVVGSVAGSAVASRFLVISQRCVYFSFMLVFPSTLWGNGSVRECRWHGFERFDAFQHFRGRRLATLTRACVCASLTVTSVNFRYLVHFRVQSLRWRFAAANAHDDGISL